MTRVVSFTLVNVYETTDEKMGFQNYAKKKNTNTKNKTKTQQTSRQTKTKQNQNIQTSERRIHYTRSIKYSKKFFLDSKIQHLIQGDKFTPLPATKEQLSYQH